MIWQKRIQQLQETHGSPQMASLCDKSPTTRKRRYIGSFAGVSKSTCAGKVYGYYAKTGFRNLIFVARMRRTFTAAVQDHIILSRVVERVQNGCLNNDFPAAVEAAVEAVLGKEEVSQQKFLRFFKVTFAGKNWIGRQLFIQCHQLQGALEVWKLLHDSKEFQLFTDQPSTDIPQRAEERWRRMREAFVTLQTTHGGLHRSQLGKVLQEFEAHHSLARDKLIARLRQQHNQQKANAAVKVKSNPQILLLRRFEQLRCKWDRAVAREEQSKRQEQALKLRECAKRRWNGKESFAEFERRVRCRT